MRPLWKDILAAVWMGMVLPGILLNLCAWKQSPGENQSIPVLQEVTSETSGPLIALKNPDGSICAMELEEYLAGVLLAEIPADFPAEALKAQAVAARTYTWKATTTGGKHGDGSICTDPACCQAYMDEQAYLSVGGTQEHLERVHHAVDSTSSMVLYYEDELIEATYFSSSGGSTEAAVAVWGAEYPYLQSVSSPEEGHVDILWYTGEDFLESLEIDLSENETLWFGPVIYTEGGGVASMEICGEIFSGVQLRSMLGLRSTAFEMTTEDGKIKITTRGYGHRVGMSQYGAKTFAEQGSTWQQILQHYYPGTSLAPICR